MPFRPHWWVKIFLRKIFGCRIRYFSHFFMPKNDPFFRFLDPPLFRAEGPVFFPSKPARPRVASHFKNEGIYRSIEIRGVPNLKKFSGAKNLVKCRKKNRASGPKIRGVQKSKKKVVFWHKKCEKFQI